MIAYRAEACESRGSPLPKWGTRGLFDHRARSLSTSARKLVRFCSRPQALGEGQEESRKPTRRASSPVSNGAAGPNGIPGGRPSDSTHEFSFRNAGPASRVVGRLAPSPTGPLHLGHAFSFLVAWWSARSKGGAIRLLMDDVDAARAHPRFIDEIIRDLGWLGIDWDGDVLQSSQYLAEIHRSAETLREEGKAYPCVCSRGDIRHVNGASSNSNRYPGTCRGRYASLDQAKQESGVEAGLRFFVPDQPVQFVDALRGLQETNVFSDCGDFLIQRRDGHPSYQLGIVVVDQHIGVTEVVRGADLLGSTARQIQLLDGLGWHPPRYLHVPLICDARGQRLSKTEGSLSLSELRHAGVTRERVLRWVANTAGQSAPVTLNTPHELLPVFREESVRVDDVPLPSDPLTLFR